MEKGELSNYYQLKTMQENFIKLEEIKNIEIGNISRNLDYYATLVDEYA